MDKITPAGSSCGCFSRLRSLVLSYAVVCTEEDKLMRWAGSVVSRKLDSLVTAAESRSCQPHHTVISAQRRWMSERLLLQTNRLRLLCPRSRHTVQSCTWGKWGWWGLALNNIIKHMLFQKPCAFCNIFSQLPYFFIKIFIIVLLALNCTLYFYIWSVCFLLYFLPVLCHQCNFSFPEGTLPRD